MRFANLEQERLHPTLGQVTYARRKNMRWCAHIAGLGVPNSGGGWGEVVLWQVRTGMGVGSCVES